MRHYMTPVARRVANGKKDRLIQPLGVPQRVLRPHPPMNRIGGMLQKVRTGGLAEFIPAGFVLADWRH
jgi:hypothetical protein